MPAEGLRGENIGIDSFDVINGESTPRYRWSDGSVHYEKEDTSESSSEKDEEKCPCCGK
jgi:hypothetical protein